MNRSSYKLLVVSLVIAMTLSWGLVPVSANSQTTDDTGFQETQKSAAQRRQEARQRLQEMLKQRQPQQETKTASPEPSRLNAAQPPVGINPAVDINLPNWSYSPNLRKFVDSLPGLGADNANNLGQYIPVAVPDTTTYPGSDYYEIELRQYTEKMHSDLPPTKLRGYVQVRNGADVTPIHYLGPIIVAQRGRAVRVKFTNKLPTGAGGDLFIPVDTTIMGSGMFHTMDAAGNMRMGMFTQNRATLHLHGGLSPWISDGTPHQWITPAGENTMYPRGVSVSNVPDMPDPGAGSQTFYWTNEQSARLMFYHDHSYGITRLNVYVGEAAGYMITDQVEEDLIARRIIPDRGGAYHNGIPIVIQDKSFVNDATTPPHASFPTGYTPTSPTEVVDPLWYTHIPGSKGGELWFPHEYLPNENLYDGTGFWPMGRWDYGPWILPPMFPMNDTLPSPSAAPEAFMDTMVVNGTAFPYVELPPTAVRFRILNACNDRMLNLSLFKADPSGFAVTDTTGASWGTEVKMVPAAPNPDYPSWPRDGRDGGVPDPTTAGPDIIQIGNEAGFLAKVAVVPAQPIDYDYDRTSATFGSVSSTALMLPPAVRADVIVDLSQCNDGDTLILYNDAPAPIPLYDARYDIFTDDPGDRTVKGGAPVIPPGFGPNTRTIMQIRVKGTKTAAFDLTALQTALPKAFEASQEHILVPASAYNDAYSSNYPDIYANIADETLNITGQPQPVARIVTELPGFGYTTPPTVKLYGGGGTGATAVATLNGVTGITLLTSGSGYLMPPTVTISGGGGTGATAEAIVSGGVVTSVVITNPGSNYTTAPVVTMTGGGGTGATALATITLGSVGSIRLTNPGSGYTQAPYVILTGGGGMGAVAVATLPGSMVMDGKNLVEGMDMEYGRMNAVLGSTPNPLTPTVGAGPVIGAAFYIDPPTEVLEPDQTRLWRLMHVGVDSHSLHFHLFDVQVINRVDWTNTVKPPYPDEIGWRETIRTNPFEDIIVALRPKASTMKLPFGIPDSVRLLDPTMPMGVTGHFQPVVPPIGIPNVAQITNVMTNFGWEYVWHCHLLGHEENDMMRPIVFNAPLALAPAPTLSGTIAGSQVNLTWVDPTPVDAPSTPGNPANEIGFRIERATGTTGTFAPVGRALANKTTYTDTRPNTTTVYRYRVVAFNAAGDSASNIISVGAAPSAPTNLRATVNSSQRVTLTWRDNSYVETGFEVERSDNGGAFVKIATAGPKTGIGTDTSYVDNTVVGGSSYSYRVRAVNGVVTSGYSNTVSVSTPTAPAIPAAPTNLSVTAARAGTYDTVTLRWTDASNNETLFRVQRSTSSTFASNVLTGTVSANVTSTTSSANVPRGRRIYCRVRAENAAGVSAWSNTASVVTP